MLKVGDEVRIFLASDLYERGLIYTLRRGQFKVGTIIEVKESESCKTYVANVNGIIYSCHDQICSLACEEYFFLKDDELRRLLKRCKDYEHLRQMRKFVSNGLSDEDQL